MTIQEIRDRVYAVWKCYEEALDAFMADVAKGDLIFVCDEDVTAVIAQEKAEECSISRAIFEHFDKLAAAD